MKAHDTHKEYSSPLLTGHKTSIEMNLPDFVSLLGPRVYSGGVVTCMGGVVR